MPSKGSWVEIWRFTLEAGDIEYSLGGGDYTLTCTSSVTATATFSNGASNTLSAEAKANLQIHIEAPQLTVLKVDIQSQAWRQNNFLTFFLRDESGFGKAFLRSFSPYRAVCDIGLGCA
jgi:hypothetical protein